MAWTKETLKASEKADSVSRDAHVNEPSQIPHEDLSPERVRQAVIYTRQDVILLYSMLVETHDQLVRIKRRIGVGIIILAMVIIATAGSNSGY